MPDTIEESEAALYCLEKALALDPSSLSLYGSKGITLNKLGKHDAAIEAFNRVTSSSSSQLAALGDEFVDTVISLKAISLVETGRYGEAQDCYEKLIAKHPGDTLSWMGLGCVFMLMEQWGIAKQAFKMVLDIDPENAAAKQKLETCIKKSS